MSPPRLMLHSTIALRTAVKPSAPLPSLPSLLLLDSRAPTSVWELASTCRQEKKASLNQRLRLLFTVRFTQQTRPLAPAARQDETRIDQNTSALQ
jgi:hypothetical protein